MKIKLEIKIPYTFNMYVCHNLNNKEYTSDIYCVIAYKQN